MNNYIELPEVEEIAKRIIPEMGWIDIPKIKFLVLVADKSRYLGKCSKASKKWRHLTGYDYVIEVWQTFFDSAEPKIKEALLFHELAHIESYEKKDGSIVWGLKKHDIEEFMETVKRYGAWNLGLEKFYNVLSSDAKFASKVVPNIGEQR